MTIVKQTTPKKWSTDHTSSLINMIGEFITIGASPILIGLFISITDNILGITLVLLLIDLIMFWAIQFIYHSFEAKQKHSEIFRRIDRASLLFLISGLFSPFIRILYPEKIFYLFVITFWVVAIIGLSLLLFIDNVSRALTPSLSFFQGLLGLILLSIKISQIQNIARNFFAIGAILMIAGGIIYVIQKPNLIKNIFEAHELFHFSLGLGICAFCVSLYFTIISF